MGGGVGAAAGVVSSQSAPVLVSAGCARCGGAVSWLCRLRTFLFSPVACQQVVGVCLAIWVYAGVISRNSRKADGDGLVCKRGTGANCKKKRWFSNDLCTDGASCKRCRLWVTGKESDAAPLSTVSRAHVILMQGSRCLFPPPRPRICKSCLSALQTSICWWLEPVDVASPPNFTFNGAATCMHACRNMLRCNFFDYLFAKK